MTTPTLPARLLACAETCDVYSPDQCATLIDGIGWIAMRHMLREAAAALSGREAVGEVRIADGCIVSTSIKRPLPDGGYDVVPQGATTPQPGDGVVVPREPTEAMLDAALRLQGDDAFLAKAPAVLSAFGKIYRAMIAAAPSAEGVV